MRYIVTDQRPDANAINKLILRVWAVRLEEQGYGINVENEPSTGIRAGRHVPSVTNSWVSIRETVTGQWAVRVPTSDDMMEWNDTVTRTAVQVSDRLGLPSSLSWPAFKAYHVAEGNIPAATEPADTVTLTVRQWCEGILAAAGIIYTITLDDGTLFPD